MGRIIVAAFGLLAATSFAIAEEPGYFPQGTWSATAYGAYTHSFTGERAKMGSGTIGLGYYFFDNMAINAELTGYHNDQNSPGETIYDANLLLRHHLFHYERFSFFLDVGGGITYADHRTPPTGTNFNFLLESGAGATFQLHENFDLLGGVRYFHISNARLEGPLRNPSINATQFYVGLMWRF